MSVRTATTRATRSALAITALVALALAATLGPARAAAAATPRLVSEAGGTARTAGLQREPHRVIYSGDGSALLAGTGGLRDDLRWSSWTATAGRGSGADWHDNCRPDCATGTYHAYPIMIRAYRPERVGGTELFTRITTTFTHSMPPYRGYRHRSVTYRLQYHDKTFFWSIP